MYVINVVGESDLKSVLACRYDKESVKHVEIALIGRVCDVTEYHFLV